MTHGLDPNVLVTTLGTIAVSLVGLLASVVTSKMKKTGDDDKPHAVAIEETVEEVAGLRVAVQDLAIQVAELRPVAQVKYPVSLRHIRELRASGTTIPVPPEIRDDLGSDRFR